jgi:hypothetical protein
MPPRRLHFVSVALLRRWSGPNRMVVAFDKTTGRIKRLGLRGMGYSQRIHPKEPVRFEAAWSSTENLLPSALDAVEAGVAFDQPDTVEILRTSLAIHMARSLDLIAVDDLAWRTYGRSAIENLARELATDPRTIDSFRHRHAGLDPAGPAALQLEARRLAAEIYRAAVLDVEASSFRAERILELYDDAKQVVARAGLEIGVAKSGEFLIGDAPAQAHPRGPGGIGARGGTPWRGAGTIAMPLGRKHVLGLGRKDDYIEIDAAGVEELNRRQVLTAHRFVAWHPDADLATFVADFVASARRMASLGAERWTL